MSKRKWTNKQALEAYVEANFNKAETARRLNITHVNFHQCIRRDPDLKKILEEAEELRLDMAEGVLNDLAKLGDVRAVKYLLDRKGRDRGYGEKVEVLSDENARKFSSVKITDHGKVIELK